MTATGSRAEAVDFGSPDAGAKAQSAERVSSVTRPVPLPQTTTTERNRRGRETRVVQWVTAVLSGAHITGRPPSIAEAHQRVHTAAGKWDAPAAKAIRLAWGYLWLAAGVIPAYAYVVLTEFPLIAIVAAGLIVLAIVYL